MAATGQAGERGSQAGAPTLAETLALSAPVGVENSQGAAARRGFQQPAPCQSVSADQQQAAQHERAGAHQPLGEDVVFQDRLSLPLSKAAATKVRTLSVHLSFVMAVASRDKPLLTDKREYAEQQLQTLDLPLHACARATAIRTCFRSVRGTRSALTCCWSMVEASQGAQLFCAVSMLSQQRRRCGTQG